MVATGVVVALSRLLCNCLLIDINSIYAARVGVSWGAQSYNVNVYFTAEKVYVGLDGS